MAIVVWVALGLALASQQTAASLGRPDLCGLIPGAVLPLLQSNPSCCQKKKKQSLLLCMYFLPSL
jgi:hypothetical protein